MRAGWHGSGGRCRHHRCRTGFPWRPSRQGQARRSRRRLRGRFPQTRLLAPRTVDVRHLLLAGPQPYGRLHDRLSTGTRTGEPAPPDRDAARLRREPHRCAGGNVTGPSVGTPRRRPPVGAHGHGDRGRRGGYGAILLAEKFPGRFAAVAAISPAIWTSYGEAHDADPGAYSSPESFVAADAVIHAVALEGKPVRVASGDDDPFHPGVEVLAAALPSSAHVVFAPGCHTGPFFLSQEPPSLQFLSQHLS